MKKNFSIMGIIVASALSVSAALSAGDRILIDFGANDKTTGIDSNAQHWNNVSDVRLNTITDIFAPVMVELGQLNFQRAETTGSWQAVEMKQGGTPGKQWSVQLGISKFRVTIEDGAEVTIEDAIALTEKLPMRYRRALIIASGNEVDDNALKYRRQVSKEAIDAAELAKAGREGLAFYASIQSPECTGDSMSMPAATTPETLARASGLLLVNHLLKTEADLLERWSVAAEADGIRVSNEVVGSNVDGAIAEIMEFAGLYSHVIDNISIGGFIQALTQVSPERVELWQHVLENTGTKPLYINEEYDPIGGELRDGFGNTDGAQAIITSTEPVSGSLRLVNYQLGQYYDTPILTWDGIIGDTEFKISLEDVDGRTLGLDDGLRLIETLPPRMRPALTSVSEEGEFGLLLFKGGAAHATVNRIGMGGNAPFNDFATLLFAHECGHAISQLSHQQGVHLTSWGVSRHIDDVRVSGYGDGPVHEDEAEFAKYYQIAYAYDMTPPEDRISAQTGLSSPVISETGYMNHLRKLSPARFALLESRLVALGGMEESDMAPWPDIDYEAISTTISELRGGMTPALGKVNEAVQAFLDARLNNTTDLDHIFALDAGGRLIKSTGADSGVTFSAARVGDNQVVRIGGTAVDFTGTLAANPAGTSYDASAFGDGLYVSDNNNAIPDIYQVTIGGLDDGLTYDFTFLSAFDGGYGNGNIYAELATGSTTGSSIVDAGLADNASNTNSWFQLTVVTPSNGQVVINFYSDQGNNGRLNTMEITVVNDAPVFASDPVVMPAATVGMAYVGTLAGSATDPDSADTVSYAKVSGSAWLNVANDGALSGMPAGADVGSSSWIIEAFDGHGGSTSATLGITVVGVTSVLIGDSLAGRVGHGSANPAGLGTETRLDTVLDAGIYVNAFQAHPVFVFQMTGVTAPVNITNANFSVTMTAKQGTIDFEADAYVIRTAASSTILASDYETTAQLLMSGFNESADGVGTVSLDAAGKSTFATWLKNNWVEGEYVFIGIKTDPLSVTADDTTRVYRYGFNKGGEWSAGATDAQLEISFVDQPLGSYAVWASDKGVGVMDEDFDKDGLVNLVEYALGGNPTHANDAGLLPTHVKTDNGWHYVYRRRLDAAAAGMVYTVETTTNLASGDWTETGTVEIDTEVIDSQFEAVINAVDTTGKPALFIRLRIEAK